MTQDAPGEHGEDDFRPSAAAEALVRRLGILWGDTCSLVLGAAAHGQAPPPGGLSIPLHAGGQELGTLELRGGTDGPERRVAAEAIAEALALVLVAERRQRVLERQSRSKDELVAVLAHDLRSPLNAITGWCHMLQSGALAQAQSDNAVEIIARNARAQGQLIGDVADLARLLAGRLAIEPAPLDAVAAVRDAVKAAEGQALAKGLAVQLMAASDVPLAWADTDRFAQVARLLVGHAIRVAVQGGEVAVQVSSGGTEIEIAVEAAGAGLAPEGLASLLSEERKPGASRRPGSLGLELVRRLMQLQGGSVRAESQGLGTPLRFVAVYPAAPR